MTIEEKVNHWLDGALENLEDAKILLDKKRYLMAGFLCNLAVEKMIKAVIGHLY